MVNHASSQEQHLIMSAMTLPFPNFIFLIVSSTQMGERTLLSDLHQNSCKSLIKVTRIMEMITN